MKTQIPPPEDQLAEAIIRMTRAHIRQGLSIRTAVNIIDASNEVFRAALELEEEQQSLNFPWHHFEWFKSKL